ncbi:hypothetical protein FQA39_LY01419 [Lamprigera yunnana]|nr:hypothetical protein FQA39_LY01419 [Lamprigera yunnana]
MALRSFLTRKTYYRVSKRVTRVFCSSYTPTSQNDESSNKEGNKFSVFQNTLLNGPQLKDFFKNENLKLSKDEEIPYLKNFRSSLQKVFFYVYGCQMNVNDTEIIWSILKANNYIKTDNVNEADVVLLVTCAIREGAENKIWNRLECLKGIRKKQLRNKLKGMKIGVLGCMAERLKHKLLEKERSVDVVAGPDSYRDLPLLLASTSDNQTAINVQLSVDETYADVMPVRMNESTVTAFVSIMRGCDNMCTYCIVPFTRGRERSRPISSILDEVRYLSENGIKEITLLGQNVNSYRDVSQGVNFYTTTLAKGFRTVYKSKVGGIRFATLLDKVAEINPEIRIRFTSPHPKDFPDEVLEVIKMRSNVCKNLHLPAQSGNSNVLERMRRGYTRESYLELVQHVKKILPNVALSSDFICGFCGETEEEFADTLSLLQIVRYNWAYMFPYSMRERTTAHRRFEDDVSPIIKHLRLEQLSSTFRLIVQAINRSQIGQTQLVLVEGKSKRSDLYVQGRNDGNCKVIFPSGDIPDINGTDIRNIKPGDYVVVQINSASSQVLKGIPLYHSTLINFYTGLDTYRQEYIHYNSML